MVPITAVPLASPDKVSPKITETVDTEKKTKDIYVKSYRKQTQQTL